MYMYRDRAALEHTHWQLKMHVWTLKLTPSVSGEPAKVASFGRLHFTIQVFIVIQDLVVVVWSRWVSSLGEGELAVVLQELAMRRAQHVQACKTLWEDIGAVRVVFFFISVQLREADSAIEKWADTCGPVNYVWGAEIVSQIYCRVFWLHGEIINGTWDLPLNPVHWVESKGYMWSSIILSSTWKGACISGKKLC